MEDFHEVFRKRASGINAEYILNMDETPFCFCWMPGKHQTPTPKPPTPHRNYQSIMSTSGYKKSLTIIISISKSGHLLKTLIVFRNMYPASRSISTNNPNPSPSPKPRSPREHPRPLQSPHPAPSLAPAPHPRAKGIGGCNVQVASMGNESGWMSPHVFQQWVDLCLMPYLLSKGYPFVCKSGGGNTGVSNTMNTKGALLLLDQHKIHRSTEFMSKLEMLKDKYNISYLFLPLGTSGIIQPVDIEIGRKLRKACKREFESWFERVTGEPRSPTREEYILIIRRALSNLNNLGGMMSRAFAGCEGEIEIPIDKVKEEIMDEENIKNFMRKETPINSQDVQLFAGEGSSFPPENEVAENILESLEGEIVREEGEY